MTKKLRVYAEAPEPVAIAGLPRCRAECGRLYQGVCRLMAGLHAAVDPGDICVPGLREMAAEVEDLRAEVARKVEPLSDAERRRVEEAIAGITGNLSGWTVIAKALDRMQGKQGGG